jgi:hypothetical protein
MRASTTVLGVILLMFAAAGCEETVCECETRDGEPVQVTRPSDGSCDSLAGEESVYQFCYAREQSFATGPSVARPVNGFTAILDSLAGSAGAGAVVFPDPAARSR